MNRILAVVAAGEAVAGLALLVSPTLVAALLFGDDLGQAGIVTGRVAGAALLSLALACWPATDTSRHSRSIAALWTYSALVTVLFVYVGLAGGAAGRLLWPATALHVAVAVLLGLAWYRQ